MKTCNGTLKIHLKNSFKTGGKIVKELYYCIFSYRCIYSIMLMAGVSESAALW